VCVCVCVYVCTCVCVWRVCVRERDKHNCVCVCVCGVDALDMKDKVRVLTDPPNWQIGWCVETHEKNSLK